MEDGRNRNLLGVGYDSTGQAVVIVPWYLSSYLNIISYMRWG
jgi:hypothetical protein